MRPLGVGKLRVAALGAILAPMVAVAAPGCKPREVPPIETRVVAVPLPGVVGGVGFDDLRYSERRGRAIVPGGGTGALFFLDLRPNASDVVDGFSPPSAYAGGSDVGVTSADEGHGVVFVTDRSTLRLSVVDLATMREVRSAPLRAPAERVRFVDLTDELWVSEPSAKGIEIFALEPTSPPTPYHVAFLDLGESHHELVIDPPRGRVYTNVVDGQTLEIDLHARVVLGRLMTCCGEARGLAIDPIRGFLFTGCREGKVCSRDLVRVGMSTSGERVGPGVGAIDYDRVTHRVLAASADDGTLSVLDVSDTGRVTRHGSAPTARGAHCVTSDQAGGAYVCDPENGRLLFVRSVEAEAPGAE